MLGVKLGVCYDSESIPSIYFARKTFILSKNGPQNYALVMTHHFSQMTHPFLQFNASPF